jgi:hypothetical protein
MAQRISCFSAIGDAAFDLWVAANNLLALPPYDIMMDALKGDPTEMNRWLSDLAESGTAPVPDIFVNQGVAIIVSEESWAVVVLKEDRLTIHFNYEVRESYLEATYLRRILADNQVPTVASTGSPDDIQDYCVHIFYTSV